MADAELWLHVVAGIGALYDIARFGVEYGSAYLNRSENPATRRAAEQVNRILSTYSNDEVRDLESRIDACRKRFIAEGSGVRRAGCLCSVLRDIKDGNGGDFPLPEWEEMYLQLKCDA